MKILYKYVANPDFILKDGYIRATQLSALNDPFEANYCENGLRKLAQELNYSHGIDTDLCEYLHKNKNRVGVICLTESKENLLMWSHYADEHKGCVLGFRVKSSQEEAYFNFFEHLATFDSCSMFQSPFNGIFEPVNYRKQPRYRIDSFDVDYSNFHEDQLLFEIFQRKSDEWIYEKEHRSILRLAQADRVIVTDEALASHHNFNRFLSVAEEVNCYKKQDEGHCFYLETISDRDWRMVIGEILEQFAQFRDVLYLFRVNKSSITSITYGFNSTHIEKMNEYKALYPSRFFEHWKTSLNRDYYTLDFNEIDIE